MLGRQREARHGSIENPANVSVGEWSELQDSGGVSDAGEHVTLKKATGYAPLFQAVSKIGGDCAGLPLDVFERQQGTDRQKRGDHYLAGKIGRYRKANREATAFKVFRRWYNHALLWGNGYLWASRSPGGRVDELINLVPDRTAPYRIGGVLYIKTEVNGELWRLPAEDVLHLEGVCVDNATGIEILSNFRHDFGLALAARKFTSKFFANGAHLGGILQVPSTSTPKAVRKVQNSLDQKMVDQRRSFKTLVLRDNYRWQATTVEPEKAQVTEIDEAGVRNVARMFNLSPAHLGVKESVSYNSREQERLDYHSSTLGPWLHQALGEFNTKLLSKTEQERGVFIDYNVNALLWADAKTRSEIAKSGIESGRFSPNETRAWENYNGYEGGEKHWQPANMNQMGDESSEE